MSDWFFCICDQEWCWCTNKVPTMDTPCDACREGVHVMDRPEE